MYLRGLDDPTLHVVPSDIGPSTLLLLPNDVVATPLKLRERTPLSQSLQAKSKEHLECGTNLPIGHLKQTTTTINECLPISNDVNNFSGVLSP